MYLLLEIPTNDMESYTNVSSIDEIAQGGEEVVFASSSIPPDTAFMGHCSNLQAWAENNYDTRILHSNLAFPLLKKLVNAGDPVAKKVFKEEIARRFESGFPPTLLYLVNNKYLDYLDSEERETLIENLDLSVLQSYRNTDFLPLLCILYELGVVTVKDFYLPYVYSILESDNIEDIYNMFLKYTFANLLTNDEYVDIVFYFLEKMSGCKRGSFYPIVLKRLIRTLEELHIHDEQVLQRIYTHVFSQVTREGLLIKNWSELIFLILKISRDLKIFPFLINKLLPIFGKLNCYIRCEIFIYLIARLKHSEAVESQFKALSHTLGKTLAGIGEIGKISDEGYLIADLLLALDETPLLKEYTFILDTFLAFILLNLELKPFKAKTKLMNTLICSIYSISNRRIRKRFISTLEATTRYNRERHLMSVKLRLIVDPLSIDKLMRANGMKDAEVETAIAMVYYLESLVSEVIKEAYTLMRHAGEKLITAELMEFAITQTKYRRRIGLKY